MSVSWMGGRQKIDPLSWWSVFLPDVPAIRLVTMPHINA